MRITILISALAVASMTVTPAAAQKLQEEPRRAEATRLYQEGLKLHNKDMEAEALEKHQQAYALYPSPNILFNIALEEKLLGRKLEALRHFREALRNPLLDSSGVELGKQYVTELEPSFARVDVKGPAGLVVKLGNEEVTLPLPEPLDIEPGTIMATGVMHGKRYHESVTVAAGQVATIKLHAPGGTHLDQSQVKEGEKNFWSPQHITGVALGGAAVVAAGLGVGFLVMHNSRASDANAYAANVGRVCNSSTKDMASCNSYQSKKDSANNAKTGSIVSFVAAGALAVGAVALLVPWQQWMTKEGSRVSARVVPTGQGILIDGAF